MKIPLSLYNDDKAGRDVQVTVIRPGHPIEVVVALPADEGQDRLVELELGAGDLILLSVPGT